MPNTNSKNINYSEDDIQDQITELMGPPPLQTSKSETLPASKPLAKNIDNPKNNNDINDKSDRPQEISDASISKAVAAGPGVNSALSTKKVKTAKQNTVKPSTDEPVDSKQDDIINKSITIEQAQKDYNSAHGTPEDLPNDYIDQADEQTDSIYSPQVLKAVKDIESREDRELDVLDEAETLPTKQKNNFPKSKKLRLIALAIILLLVLVLLAIPYSRYKTLNLVGVRSSVSLSVIDQKTQTPLKNANINIGGAVAKTSDQGTANITGVKLGQTKLTISKRSFATIEQPITIGWGSNPISTTYSMQQVGQQYSFIVTDFLSGNKISGAKITDGESSAISDNNGLATVKIEPTDKQIDFTVSADQYRQDIITSSDSGQQQIKLVPAQSLVYVSNRNGKLDLYKKDADGKNETVLLPGVGSEIATDLSVLSQPESTKVAFVSTRDKQHNSDGYPLSYLYIVDTKTKQVTKVDGSAAEKIQLFAWNGEKLIYVKISAGNSGANQNRQKIIAYDLGSDKIAELASANNFNDIMLIGNSIYFAPSSDSVNNTQLAKLYKINTDGSNKKVILDQEAWLFKRNSPETLLANTSDKKWQSIDLVSDKIIDTQNFAKSQADNSYQASPDGKMIAWSENHDGKGILMLSKSKNGSSPVQLSSASGLSDQIVWLNNRYIMYRVVNMNETAEYVVNIEGGKPIKVSDITTIAKTGRWYYL